MAVVVEAPRTGTTSIVTRLRDRAQSTPDRVALREKDLGIWTDITWAEYWDRVRDVAHGLLALGVEPGDRVAIHSENRPEWVYSDLAIVAIRALTMGLYPTNPPPEVQYLLSNSASKILIAEDQEQVDKALAVKADLPDLRKIIYIDPRGVRNIDDPLLMSWLDLIELGKRHRAEFPEALDRLIAEAEPDDVMTLIYTSGTTGPPKGAMLTIQNVEFAIAALVHGGGFTSPPPTDRDVLLSYLPLCHVAERIFTVWFNLAAGCVVNFAESIETVPQNLQEVQPTIFLGVPRIWEKMHAGIQIRAANASWIKRTNFRFWMKIADRISATLVRTGGTHTAVDQAPIRARLRVPVPSAARAHRHAEVSLRGLRRGPHRPRDPSILHGGRGADARGLRDDRELGRRNRQSSGQDQAGHRRRGARQRRAEDRRGHGRDPHQAPGGVRRLLA